MLAVLKSRPAVSTKTSAASSASDEEDATAPTSVRGGTSGSSSGSGDGAGDFSIDPKVVQPGKQAPAKKFR